MIIQLGIKRHSHRTPMSTGDGNLVDQAFSKIVQLWKKKQPHPKRIFHHICELAKQSPRAVCMEDRDIEERNGGMKLKLEQERACGPTNKVFPMPCLIFWACRALSVNINPTNEKILNNPLLKLNMPPGRALAFGDMQPQSQLFVFCIKCATPTSKPDHMQLVDTLVLWERSTGQSSHQQ